MANDKTIDQVKDVSISLNRIRKKLLDLSRRNRLLNYRAGSRSLTFVDELPDQVFKVLVADGKTMYFEPLPEPEEENREPDFFPQPHDLTVTHPQGKSPDIGFPTKTEKELPTPSQSAQLESKHNDHFLQTQLYARDLERRLKKISGDAQTAIEESGTNILYLAIGFLEWYEDDNSDQKSRAPLILIPVGLERGKLDIKAFLYKYSLSYTGEDISYNLSLAEKLKQDFGIVLPEIEDELEPEKYLEQVREVVGEKKRWRVAREIVLGMFSFGKLLMYLDLNPANWPADKSIAKHLIIGALLEGSKEADGNPYGETYKIDDDSQAAAIPLVVDADSSQHSAVIDAISGRNLVIEGPPGTGKSQTITNLIGIALAQGKSVLFVSEKLAALEVVRRNLDKAGLGDFCLELHSHKTQKQKLLKDIEVRLKKKYRKVERHEETMSELNKIKKTLQAYVDVINEHYGQTEMTVHEILWCAERARNAFTNPPRIQVENAKNVNRLDITQRMDALNTVKSHWMEVEPDAFAVWRGYLLYKFYQYDESDIEELLLAANTGITQLIEAAKALPPEIGNSKAWTLGATLRLATSLKVLNYLPSSLDQEIIAIVVLDEAKLLISMLEIMAHTGSSDGKAHGISPDKSAGEIKTIATAFDKLIQLVKAKPTAKAVAERLIMWRTSIVGALADLEQDSKSFLKIVGIPFPNNLRDVHEFCRAASLAAKAPSDVVGYTKPSMLSEGSLSLLTKAESESNQLSVRTLALGERFILTMIPDQEALKKIRQVLSVHENRFFRFLSSEYRWAKSQLQGFTKDINALSRGTYAHSVDELIGYLDARETYARNKEYKDHFGELFSGKDTDWARLRRLLSWTEELRQTISNRQLLAVLLSRNERVIFSLGNEHAQLQKSIKSFVATLSEILNQLVQTSQWATAVKATKIPSLVEQWLFTKDSRDRAKILSDFAATIQPIVKGLDETLNKLWSFGECNQKEFFGCIVQELPLPALRDKLGACLATLSGAGKWADYCRAVQHAKTLGLQELIDLVERGTLTHNLMVVAYEYALYSSLAKTIIREHPLLRDFTRVSHEKIRAKFAELDSQILWLNRELIAHQASGKKPPDGQSSGPIKRYTEMGLIYHEIGKKKRHVPIRQLVAKAGRALQVIKPCFMMGPLSVAQYLSPGNLEFDLVIMDEASQVKPEEALGAIARGKQIIIVGDPKQLPPTSFFDRIGEVPVDEDEELALDDSESILDICIQIYRPARRLCWHYRSEHESLINFSNHEFYDNDLILFPSPVGIGHGLGIRRHYISNALYENRRNKAEAETVARTVLTHTQRYPELSLGVGTFNIQQKEVIEDYIERMRTANPALDEFIERQSANGAPFFVKNLENIQGDERDVIFISTTYGPDSSRRVAQRFGPINTDGGWRRLNVIVTRAKKRVELFTSMHSSDVLVSSSSSRGVRALRAYLEYAEKGGVVPTEVVDTGKEPDSPFEESVAHVLMQVGYSVVPQIGVAGYFIDIGVRHPSRPDEYILGVECDGAMYHSALSARDRDRLRQDVLEHRGWKIHRIWSTDWFNNREAEIRRLLQRIEQCLKETGGTIQSTVTETSIGYEQPFTAVAETTRIASSAESPHAAKRGVTITEARQRLLDLYKNKVLPEFPNHEKSILRKEMLEALLRNVPTTPQEFRELIPLRFREATDSNHMKFLTEILEILKEISD